MVNMIVLLTASESRFIQSIQQQFCDMITGRVCEFLVIKNFTIQKQSDTKNIKCHAHWHTLSGADTILFCLRLQCWKTKHQLAVPKCKATTRLIGAIAVSMKK